MAVVTFRWRSNRLEILDQRLLPHQIKYIICRGVADVARAIRAMAVRGAPAIGCCAAYGMALAQNNELRITTNEERTSYLVIRTSLLKAASMLKSARPTAVNLAWAVDRMLKARGNLLTEARRIEREDVVVNKAMGAYGAKLLSKNSIVLTHCNAGALATAGYGTALGIIRAAYVRGKIKKVLVDETRPYLQGARLTAWELVQEKIPHELITDNMAGHFMRAEKVSAVIVGCDRVAANGDTANKIGTYALAILAKYHRIPFYVAMPTSTLDLSISSGRHIPIEERSPNEVVKMGSMRIAPLQTKARHPAFDVTPFSLITAFVTEHGIVTPPFKRKLVRHPRMLLAGIQDN